jgi:hypothetical protein
MFRGNSRTPHLPLLCKDPDCPVNNIVIIVDTHAIAPVTAEAVLSVMH